MSRASSRWRYSLSFSLFAMTVLGLSSGSRATFKGLGSLCPPEPAPEPAQPHRRSGKQTIKKIVRFIWRFLEEGQEEHRSLPWRRWYHWGQKAAQRKFGCTLREGVVRELHRRRC